MKPPKPTGSWPPACQYGNCTNPSNRLTLNGRRCAYHLEKDKAVAAKGNRAKKA